MNLGPSFAFAGAFSCALLALAIFLRERRCVASGLLVAGLAALAIESVLLGFVLQARSVEELMRWQRWQWSIRAGLPGLWLAFSLTYSRGNYREFLARWKWSLAGFVAVPGAIAIAFGDQLLRLIPEADGALRLTVGTSGQLLALVFLLAAVLLLMNLERTFRTAVGTMRWRIKFVVLGLFVIFGARIFTSSQTLLFSQVNPAMGSLEAAALLIGCAFIAVSYLRTRLLQIDVYPSHSFLYGSMTVFMAGIYLLVVGAFAQVVAAFGGDASFQIKAFLILLGISGLAALLLSDRVKQRTQRFVSRHLRRPQYDYHKMWSLVTERTAHLFDQPGLCAAAATLVSETFNVLSVTIWMADSQQERLVFGASTLLSREHAARVQTEGAEFGALVEGLRRNQLPFEIRKSKEPWAAALKQHAPDHFEEGGPSICVPMFAGEQLLGLITLSDRVSGIRFSLEELDLLNCIGNQVAKSLLNAQLSQRLVQAKEREAFQTMSTFFIHDLKNAASTLSLMVRNLPVHFDDPAFREDAARAVAKTANHINSLITRLTLLRRNIEIQPVDSDLNELVSASLCGLDNIPDVSLVKNFAPLPKIAVDPEQIQNVITNLVLNARDAVGQHGEIIVQTSRRNGWAVMTVSDNGSGMTPEFLQKSIFRPFQTTKKGGMGIGVFQCKTIVEAHRGRIEVESEFGKGTTFRVLLPLEPAVK